MIKAMTCALILWISATVSAEAYPMASKRPDVFSILRNVSQQTGVPYNVFHTFGAIESTFNPRARTGSYKGLFQLSNSEFDKYGGGKIYDPEDNARAFAGLVKNNASTFKSETGKDPNVFDLYMMHQQGTQGYLEHVANPDQPAWRSMYATGEGQQKGPGWAKKAIWGNLPSSAKRQFGSVDNVTSGDFLNAWKARVVKLGSNDDIAAGGGSPPLQGQRVSFPERNQYTNGPLPEDAGVRSIGDRSLKSPTGGDVPAILPMPSSRSATIGSPDNKGYGQIGGSGQDWPDTPSQAPQGAVVPPIPSSAPSQTSNASGGPDFPWPGTAPLNWTAGGLVPGASVPTSTPPSSPGPVGIAGGIRPAPLFSQFFSSLFGGF